MQASSPLSRAEREVYALTVQGLCNDDVATQLFVCTSTVKDHLTCVYKKLGVRSRAELIVQYYKLELSKLSALLDRLEENRGLPRGILQVVTDAR